MTVTAVRPKLSRRGLLALLPAGAAILLCALRAAAQSERVTAVLSRTNVPLASEDDLVGLRICGAFGGGEYEHRLESLGAALFQLPSSETPVALQTGICDAVFLSADTIDDLRTLGDLIFGGAHEYSIFEVH